MWSVFVVALIGVVAGVPNYSVSVTEQEEEAVEAPAQKHIDFDTSRPPISVNTGKCERREENCYEDQADFVQMCKMSYNGIVNGPRCFIYAEGNTVWEGIFDKCAAKGTEVAQFHTEAEYQAIVTHVKANFAYGQHFWTSLRRHPNAAYTYSMPPLYTWWHKSVKRPYPRLSLANTWMRKHEADDAFAGGHYCQVLYYHEYVGDNPCTNQFPTFCLISNKAQTFNYIKGQCLEETAIETHYEVSIRECAKRCAAGSVWCRSFNYYDNFQCDLFSFVVTDTFQKATDRTDCFHYSYKG